MAENKDYNIVNTEESLKTIDKNTIDPPVKAPKLKAQQYDVLPNNSKVADKFQQDTNYHVGIDVSKYANDINKGNIVLGPLGVEGLNEDRANQQPWYVQARNMVGQAVVGEIVGGTIEGLGYLGEVGNVVDYLNGEEKEFGNFLTDLGKETREFSQNNMPIYQTKDSGMGDSGWWYANGVSVASTLSMLIPSTVATKALGFLGKGVSTGLGMLHESMDIASKMGKYERWMATGISQAVISRHIENSMEASGVFNEQYDKLKTRINPNTGEYFTDDEAKDLASTAASSTYKADWAMLLQDIPQYLAIGKVFNPITMKMEQAGMEAIVNGTTKTLKDKALAGLAVFGSEGFEEGYQYFVAERGKLLSDLKAGLISKKEYEKELNSKMGDEEMLTSAFWGGLGGNIFNAVGSRANDLFKSNSTLERERMYAENTAMYLRERGQSFEAMQLEIAKADQTGDPVKRKAAIEGSGVQMTIEALDNDKFDSYIESLNGMADMSDEERQGFQDKYGIELNDQMFKEYIPSLIEQAGKIKKSYLKYSNKYDSSIAAKLASNDHYINVFNERVFESEKEMQDIKKSIPNEKDLTPYYRDKFNTKGNILALKTANKIHQQAIDNTSSAFKIENRNKLIEKNNKLIDKLESQMKEFNSNDPRTKDEKDNDKLIGSGYESQADELIGKAAEKILLNDSINLMQNENIKLKTKAYQQELRHQKMQERVNTLQNVNQAEQAKLDLAEDKLTTKEKKEEINKMIDDRIKEILIEDKNKQALANQAVNKDNLDAESKDFNKNNLNVVPDNNITPVGNNLEDEFSTEEADIHSEMVRQSDSARKKMSEASENIGIYSATGNKNYQEWMLNGKNKIGTEVDIYAENTVYSGSRYPELVRQAIDDFNNGIVNSNVYNHLPLKIYIGYQENQSKDDEISAFLSARLEGQNAGYEAAWNRQDFPIRKALIDEMVKNPNKTTKSVVSVQYGGMVNQADATDGIIPENNIGDFQHLSPKIDEMFNLNGANPTPDQTSQAIEDDIMYTNEYGELMNMNGDRHKDFIGRQIMLPSLTGATGPRVPMKGTVFLSVPKADGTLFPLKLNIKKHTQAEAEIIASLLTSVVTKENKFNTPLSKLDGKYADKIREEMQDALNAMESEDPSLIDIVDFHTYVSDKTIGKASELYVKGEWVKFGDGDLKVTPQALFNYEKLVEFLVNTKRRQFNVALWQSNPSYRDYAIASGLVNTDAITNGPLFGGKTDIYIKSPIIPKAPQNNAAKMLQHSASLEQKVPSRKERISMSMKDGVYSDKSTNGKFAGTYYDQSGSAIQLLRDTEELAKQAVNDKYKAEMLTDTTDNPATPAVVETQPKKTSNKFGADLEEENITDGIEGEVDVIVKKDGKSNFTLTVKPDDIKGAIVVNKNTGTELDPIKDKKLINKALLKSGVLKYEKITNNNHVYAYTQLGTIINITPGSASNGSEIQLTSPVGKKIISQSKRIFDGSADAIEASLYEEMGSQTNTSTSFNIEDVKVKNQPIIENNSNQSQIDEINQRRKEELKNSKDKTKISPREILSEFLKLRGSNKHIQALNERVDEIGEGSITEDTNTELFSYFVALGVKPFKGNIDRNSVFEKQEKIEQDINKELNQSIKDRGLKRITNEAREIEQRKKISEISAKYDTELNLINNEQQVSIKKIEDNFVNNGNDQGAFAEKNEAKDLNERINEIKNKLGHSKNVEKFEQFIKLLDNAKNQLTIEQIDLITKHISNNSVAIVGGTTDTNRNNIERADLDTAWITEPSTLKGVELQEYSITISKLFNWIQIDNNGQQPQMADASGAGSIQSNKESNPLFIGDIVKEILSNTITSDSDPITDLFGKREIIDPKTLLMNPNSLDLSNEIAVLQEQDDISSLDEVNESTDILDNAMDHNETDFSEVDNTDVQISDELYSDDAFSNFLNDNEDDLGCGF